MDKKYYEKGMIDGVKIATQAFTPELERLRAEVRRLELEILLNKKDWRTVNFFRTNELINSNKQAR